MTDDSIFLGGFIIGALFVLLVQTIKDSLK